MKAGMMEPHTCARGYRAANSKRGDVGSLLMGVALGAAVMAFWFAVFGS